MPEIILKEVGSVPAKRAGDFKVGEIIAKHYGYVVKVLEVESSIDGSKVRMKVEHVPEEREFYDDRSWHHEEYESSEMLGIGVRFP